MTSRRDHRAIAEGLHGPLRGYDEREKMKRPGCGAEARCRSHFERSVLSPVEWATQHPTFDVYASHWQVCVDSDYSQFRDRFPVAAKPMLPFGYTVWWDHNKPQA